MMTTRRTAPGLNQEEAELVGRPRLETGVILNGQWPLDRILHHSTIIEKYAFDYVWLDDSPDAYDPYLTLLAINHVAPRLSLGIGTINPSLRHPAILAASAATLAEASHADFILGLGCSYAHLLAPYGIELSRRTSQMRETLKIIRGLLAGDATTVEGDTFSTRDVRLTTRPAAATRLLIGVTGGPTMLAMSGQSADGIIVPGGTFSYYDYMIGSFRSARESAGHHDAGYVVLNGNVVVADGRPETEASARELVAETLSKRAYNEFAADQMGISQVDAEAWTKDPRRIPDRVVAETVAFGSATECASWLGRIADLGVSQFVLRYPREDEIRSVGEKVLPLLRPGSAATA
jgi:alkanesulfonate monooxygenase SsuD/methylene tetrahydromethanopterin reductase-like flavin-dependent oxidoreductase (luciferase family)